MRTMPVYKHAIIAGVIVLNVMMGLRGLWNPQKDIFTLHPYYRPISTCSTSLRDGNTVVPFPERSYFGLAQAELRPGYLELLPLYAKGLQQTLGARVEITCTPLHPFPLADESLRIVLE